MAGNSLEFGWFVFKHLAGKGPGGGAPGLGGAIGFCGGEEFRGPADPVAGGAVFSENTSFVGVVKPGFPGSA